MATAAAAAALASCTGASEKQEKVDWGLVYDGAITENVAGQVNLHPVKYDLRGITVAATRCSTAAAIWGWWARSRTTPPRTRAR